MLFLLIFGKIVLANIVELLSSVAVMNFVVQFATWMAPKFVVVVFVLKMIHDHARVLVLLHHANADETVEAALLVVVALVVATADRHVLDRDLLLLDVREVVVEVVLLIDHQAIHDRQVDHQFVDHQLLYDDR